EVEELRRNQGDTDAAAQSAQAWEEERKALRAQWKQDHQAQLDGLTKRLTAEQQHRQEELEARQHAEQASLLLQQDLEHAREETENLRREKEALQAQHQDTIAAQLAEMERRGQSDQQQ